MDRRRVDKLAYPGMARRFGDLQKEIHVDDTHLLKGRRTVIVCHGEMQNGVTALKGGSQIAIVKGGPTGKKLPEA